MDTATQQAPADPPKVPVVDPARDAEENKDIAALGYVWILSVFVFFAKRHSPFVRFHARQGMALFALSIPAWFIPYAGKAVEIVILALAVLGFIGAAQGLWKELPVIGALVRGDKAGMRKSWRHVTESTVKGWQEARSVVDHHTETPPPPAASPSAPPVTPSQPPSPPVP